jgi:hypothetical protein
MVQATNSLDYTGSQYSIYESLQRFTTQITIDAITHRVATLFISKMYFILWMPQEGSERMWNVQLDASSSGEYQTVGGHSGWPSK